MDEQVIGNYRVIKKIGAGGMAQVYLAVHKDIPNLKVVLKILSDPRLVERFKQEADKLALLDGQGNICQIKHFFNHGDDIVIAMEYIDGVTLDDAIKQKGKLPANESMQIISDVLGTLQFAHEKGVFHRDIKPSNVMIDTRGRVKIIDFGIAKGKSDPSLTITGSSCGTPSYMPPEQFNPTEGIDYARVDVYAVGTTMFLMLTGQLPFAGDNQFALRDAKLFNDPPRPRDLNADISKKLEEVILKALAKDPEDRYASAAEMQAAVNALREGVAVADLTEAVPLPPKPRPPAEKKPFPKMIPIGALVVIVGIAVAYLLFIRPSGPALPQPPRLLSPENGAVVTTATPLFSWQPAGDEPAIFILEYAADSTFAVVLEKPSVMSTTYSPAAGLPNGAYFWRVRTENGKGNISAASPSFSFIVNVPVEEKPTGTIEITIDPRGDIFIDNKLYDRNKSTATATLDTGVHQIRVVNSASREGQLSETVHVAGGESKRIPFTFSFPLERARVDSGDVRIGSLPTYGAVVFIDGHPQELRTNNTFRTSAGRHEIKVVLTLDGKELEKTRTITVIEDSLIKETFDFRQ